MVVAGRLMSTSPFDKLEANTIIKINVDTACQLGNKVGEREREHYQPTPFFTISRLQGQCA